MKRKRSPSVLPLFSFFILIAYCFFAGKGIKKVPLAEPRTIKISDSLAVKVDDEDGKFSWDAAIEQCASYGKGWHAPSMIELAILYSKKGKIGGFKNEWYWSSSEYFNDFGRSLNFENGQQNDDYEDKNHANCVRCVKTLEK